MHPRFMFRMNEATTGEEGGGMAPHEDFNSVAPTGGETKAPEVIEETAPLHVGLGGEIKTQEELIKYAKKLEDDYARDFLNRKNQEANVQPSTQQYLGTQAQADDLNPEEILENPAGFVEKLTARIENKMAASKKAEANERQFWDSFYLENPELKKYDRAVQSVLKEQWQAIETMPVAKGKEVLARESRKYIGEIQGHQGTKVTMTGSSGPTMQGGFPSQTKEQTPVKRSTFLDEVKAMRKKK